jgi:hypothetical protein
MLPIPSRHDVAMLGDAGPIGFALLTVVVVSQYLAGRRARADA